MVEVIKGGPRTGFGATFTRTFNQSMQNGLQTFLGEKDRISKGLPGVYKNVDYLFKSRYPEGTYDQDTMNKTQDRARELFVSGQIQDDFLASEAALMELEAETKKKKEQQAAEEANKPKRGFLKGAQSGLDKFMEGTLLPGIKEGAKKVGKGIKEQAKSLVNVNERLEKARNIKEDPKLMNKPVVEMTPDELYRIPKARQLSPEEDEQLQRKFDEQYFRETLGPFARGATPFNALEALEKRTGLDKQTRLTPERGTEGVEKFAGELTKLYGVGRLLSGVRGATQAGTRGKEALGFGALYGAEKAGEHQLETGKPLSPTEFLKAATEGGVAGLAAPVLEHAMKMIKAAPGAFKKLMKEAKGAEAPYKAMREKAHARREAEAAAKKAEKAGEKPAEKPAEAKPSKVEAAAGKAATEPAPKEKAPSLAGRVKEISKESFVPVKAGAKEVEKYAKQATIYSEQEAAKAREAFQKKVAESPLKDYYEPSKKEPKTAAGQASKELRQAPIKEKIEQTKADLKKTHEAILQSQGDLRNARHLKINEEGIARLNAKIKADEAHQKKLISNLKDLEFQIKHGKKPYTKEELDAQIAKTMDEFREGIKNPTAKKMEDAKKRLNDDVNLLVQGEELAARGELPGTEIIDEYVKVHKEYQKAYDALQNELKDFIKLHSKDPAMADQVKNAEKLDRLVFKIKRTNQAKIVRQLDKRKALAHLEKPSGAFTKNLLKDIHKEVAEFQKPLFQWHKMNAAKGEPLAQKKIARNIPPTEKEAVKAFKEQVKAGEKVGKDPSKENIKEAAEKAGIKEEDLGNLIKETRAKAEEAKKAVENGTATEKTVTNTTKEIDSRLRRFLRKYPPHRIAAHGLITGTIQGLMEEFFDYKPTTYIAGGIASLSLPGTLKQKVASHSLALYVHHGIQKGFDHLAENRLRKVRNDPEKFREEIKRIENKYSSARANRIKKAVTST